MTVGDLVFGMAGKRRTFTLGGSRVEMPGLSPAVTQGCVSLL